MIRSGYQKGRTRTATAPATPTPAGSTDASHEKFKTMRSATRGNQRAVGYTEPTAVPKTVLAPKSASWSTQVGDPWQPQSQKQPQAKPTPWTTAARKRPSSGSSLPVSSSYLSLDLFPPSRRGYRDQSDDNSSNSSHNSKLQWSRGTNGVTLCSTGTGPVNSTHRHCYAVDAEMVTAVGPGDAPERRIMVSIGIVNERLETVLYARVRVPEGCRVTNGAFARVEG